MYSISFDNVPSSVYKHEKRLVEAYWVNPKEADDIVVGSRRGIFHKTKDGFEKTLDKQCLALRYDGKDLYAATNNGIYVFEDQKWKSVALEGLFINALSVNKGRLLASVDKKELVLLDTKTFKVMSNTRVLISEEELQHDIKLSRFVRDLHYGRGLFDGISSLLINDYGAIVLTLLSISGYIIYYLIKTKKHVLWSRRLIKIHANIFAVIAIFPFLILLITGIFLDHPKVLAPFMRSVNIPHVILPPVYGSLQEDIWSVDLEDEIYRVGNRYGVYESSDLINWDMVSKGFAYRMKRLDETLYISGMGAANRIFREGEWKILPKTPHMFKDVNTLKEEKEFLSHKSKMQLPKPEGATLYSILLALHDGTFFATWWVWINDVAAILLLVLGLTGTIRYLKKKKLILK